MYSLLIIFFASAIIFSFLCSLWEAVLLSITPTYARLEMQNGSTIGRHLQEFKNNIDRPLTAILTLNTIAHTVGAIGVGEQAAQIWSQSSPWVTRIVVPAAMTIAVLILSEIIPKTLGAVYWQRFAKFTVHSLRFLMAILAPLIWMGQLITGSIKRDSDEAVLTRKDFLAMAELGAEEGVFDAEESHMLRSFIRFQDVEVSDVMTPRTVVNAATQNQTISEYYEAQQGGNGQFSRIPVFDEDNKDQITGYILKAHVLEALLDQRGEHSLESLRREITAVEEDYKLTDLFESLIQRKEHIAVVLDDFGGMAGIITMEDIIETLLGMEIVDETDEAIDMRKLAQRHREKRAQTLEILKQDDEQV